MWKKNSLPELIDVVLPFVGVNVLEEQQSIHHSQDHSIENIQMMEKEQSMLEHYEQMIDVNRILIDQLLEFSENHRL